MWCGEVGLPVLARRRALFKTRTHHLGSGGNKVFRRRKARFEGSWASRPSKTVVSRTRRHGMGGQGPWAPRSAKMDFSGAEKHDLKVLGPPGLQKP